MSYEVEKDIQETAWAILTGRWGDTDAPGLLRRLVSRACVPLERELELLRPLRAAVEGWNKRLPRGPDQALVDLAEMRRDRDAVADALARAEEWIRRHQAWRPAEAARRREILDGVEALRAAGRLPVAKRE
jgi:hypothetical protein